MVNVFSFSLFGPENPKYYKGLLENIELAQKHYPGWKVFVYYAPDVTQQMVEKLRTYSNVLLRETGVLGFENTVHRFFAIDEENVEVMMVRDADSRIHWKDRWAIQDFLQKPEYTSHSIRDNIVHTALIMAGLWGLRKTAGLHMRSIYLNYQYESPELPRNYDQIFLARVIYPLLLPNMLVHYSNGRFLSNEHGLPFPFEWTDDVFCGKVEGEFVDKVEPKPTNRLAGTVVNFLHNR